MKRIIPLAGLALCGLAFSAFSPAPAMAQTHWAPPPEIAGKAPPEAPTSAPPPANAPAVATTASAAKIAPGCEQQADEKKLRGKKRRHFLADCQH